MNDLERERLRDRENDVHQAMTEVFGDNIPAEVKALVIDTMFAGVDALFTIRNGGSWRNISDPKEIAGAFLREIGIGE